MTSTDSDLFLAFDHHVEFPVLLLRINRVSASRFDTSLDSLRSLKSAGVPDILIRAMVKGRIGKAS